MCRAVIIINARFIILNTKFMILNTKCIMFNPKNTQTLRDMPGHRVVEGVLLYLVSKIHTLQRY